MIKQWNGAIWRVQLHGTTLVMERYAQTPKADFPYSRVEVEINTLIDNPKYNPCGDQITKPVKHTLSGAFSLMVKDMPELIEILLEVIKNGKELP